MTSCGTALTKARGFVNSDTILSKDSGPVVFSTFVSVSVIQFWLAESSFKHKTFLTVG